MDRLGSQGNIRCASIPRSRRELPSPVDSCSPDLIPRKRRLLSAVCSPSVAPASRASSTSMMRMTRVVSTSIRRIASGECLVIKEPSRGCRGSATLTLGFPEQPVIRRESLGVHGTVGLRMGRGGGACRRSRNHRYRLLFSQQDYVGGVLGTGDGESFSIR